MRTSKRIPIMSVFVLLFAGCASYGTFGDSEQGRAVACHDDGRVTVVGEFRGSVDFGGGSIDAVGPSDIFMVTLDVGG